MPYMTMERYKNLSGQSNVLAYEFLNDGIIVQFNDRTQYIYHVLKVGAGNMSEMKRLAVAGKGLNSFINRTPEIRKGYSKRV